MSDSVKYQKVTATYVGIAQLLERLVRHREGEGSNPLTSSLRLQRSEKAVSATPKTASLI